MDADGKNIRQLCFDQDHDFHPVVLDSGKVLYLRWDYTGISHIYLRQLMTMNPDGTQQRAIYGSNSWYPNSLFFSRQIPETNRLIGILSGYHGPHRMGQLVIIDPRKGWQEASGIVQRITGRGEPIKPMIRDDLAGGDWPMFLHPYPLSDKYFLVSCRMSAKSSWGIYLADVFDNLILVHDEPDCALLEPTPVMPRKQPMVIPDKIDLTKNDATVYISDVYAGPGLKGVPRDTIRQLRIVGYNFGYRGLAGADKIGYGGPMDDPEKIFETSPRQADIVFASEISRPKPLSLKDERNRQKSFTPVRRQIDLGGVKLSLVRAPAGKFVFGDVNGQADEFPQRVITMDKPFWISECEVTNGQFRRFDPSHDSGYYSKRRDRADGKGLSLNGDEQPAVRLSCEEAMNFCHWLSKRSQLTVTLPTEQQWEYACRASSATPLNYGIVDEDFSAWASLEYCGHATAD